MVDAMNTWNVRPEDLDSLGIKTVIIASPDMQGRLVGRRVPTSEFSGVVSKGVTICTCVWSWDIEQGTELIDAGKFALCNTHNGIPDVTLMPDLSTLRRAAWLDGVAICFADPYDPHTGEMTEISPRVQLKKELQRYQETGLVPLASTELEFYLFMNDPVKLRKKNFVNLEPSTLYAADFVIQDGNYFEPFFQTLRENLAASGVMIEAAQSEHGKGQWEMTFPYGDPVMMADQHSLYKLAVRDSARRAGMSATFMALPVNGEPGSSCHMHLSMKDSDSHSLFWDPKLPHNMSAEMQSCIEGVLKYAPGLTLWFAPTVNSYKRHRGDGSAGLGNSWALGDRLATVRVVGNTAESLRFEFRTAGADANPYLALLGLLASAREGLAQKLQLREMKNSATKSGVEHNLPSNLGEAAEAFSASPLVPKLLRDEEKMHHIVLAQHEWETYVSKVDSWDLNRYFDRI
jgi:glutamine synthetase